MAFVPISTVIASLWLRATPLVAQTSSVSTCPATETPTFSVEQSASVVNSPAADPATSTSSSVIDDRSNPTGNVTSIDEPSAANAVPRVNSIVWLLAASVVWLVNVSDKLVSEAALFYEV